MAFIAEQPDRWYAGQLLLALGFVLLGAVALATAMLVRARGGALATAGALLLLIGGTAFGAAMFMYGGTAYLNATNATLTDGAGVAFQAAAEDSGALGAPFPIGFFGIIIGVVLCALALWRSGAVAWWQALLLGLLPAAIFGGFEAPYGVGAALCVGVLVGVVAVARALVRQPDGGTVASAADRAAVYA